MREKDYYGAIKGFCLKWNLPEVWNSDRITGANLIYEVIKVLNAMIVEQKETKEMIEEFIRMFDEDLSETVVTILNEWFESGKLAGIISDEVLGMKADKDYVEIFKQNKVLTSKIGMIENSLIDSETNFNILSDYISNGYTVVFDKKYFVKTPTISKLIPSNISLNIEGVNNLSEIEIIGSEGFLFTVKTNNNIRIENMRIVNNENNVKSFVHVSAETDYIPLVEINNNTILGTVTMFSHRIFDENLNPKTTLFGVGVFNFRNNIVKNTKFVTLFVACPHEKINIEDNIINNFDYVFLISSEYGDTITKSGKRNLTVKNNVVINDVDWFCPNDYGVYLTFILYEGIECVYSGNHVEGLKTNHVFSVYDAYLSCDNLEYTNNVWKNNLCLATGKHVNNNVLMQAKEGSDVVRIYRNNIFTVEKSYVQTLGKPLENAKVQLFEYTNGMKNENFIVENNIFDIYDLQGKLTVFEISGKWLFKNNVFNCEKVNGYFIPYKTVSLSNYDEVSIEISDNMFTSKSGTMQIIQGDGTDNTNIGFVVIKNNIFNGFVSILCVNVYTNLLIIEGNNVNNNYLDGGQWIVGGRSMKLQQKGNLINSKGTFMYPDIKRGFEQYDENYHVVMGNMQTAQTFTRLLFNDLNTEIKNKVRYLVEYKVSNNTGFQNTSFWVDYGYDVNQNKNYLEYKTHMGGESSAIKREYLEKGTPFGEAILRYRGVGSYGELQEVTVLFYRDLTTVEIRFDRLKGGYNIFDINIKSYMLP